jgi:FAD/FMN-containing dehydrogenase
MDTLTICSTDGRDTTIDAVDVELLAGRLRGELLTPESPGYDEARAIWNGMIDRRPALIARCESAADVIEAVRFAARHHLLLAVRGGGHNIAGSAVCDHGMMIDVSPMKSVRIDPDRRVAWVEPGVTLGEFDHDAQLFGLATPLGINSTTGVAGLTLGGGFGWLSRAYGLTIDNLLSVEIVTADGALLRASDREHPDLFWAVRGGGGNFGIVTAFEFRLHAVGPEVMAGLVIHPFDDAMAVLRDYRDAVARAPDELTCWVVLRQAPPLPFLPEEWHGKLVVVLAMMYAGDVAKGEEAMRPIRAIGSPIADAVGPHGYRQWNAAFDPLLGKGARNYWKSHDLPALPDDALRVLVDAVREVPTFGCEIFLGHLGGAAARIPGEATAYAHRDAEFVMNAHARWDDPADDERCIAWARALFTALAPHATGGVYVNFMTADETERIAAAYGGNYARLQRLKARYDPENLFRMNQNVAPGVGGGVAG